MIVLAVVLAVSAGIVVVTALSAGDGADYIGNDMGAEIASDFELTDQHGEPLALSDKNGEPVLLTFFFTNCPDVCPLTAAQIREAEQEINDRGGEFEVVIVSVDPENDNPESARAFLDNFERADRWSFLTGDEEALEAVWDDYYVGVTEETASAGDALIAAAPGANAFHEGHDDDASLMHTTPIYLIDEEGRIQVVHTTGGEDPDLVDDLIHDLEILLDLG